MGRSQIPSSISKSDAFHRNAGEVISHFKTRSSKSSLSQTALLLLQFDFDIRNNYIHEADANFIRAMQIAFDEVVAVASGGNASGSLQHDQVQESQLEAWRAHLEDKMREPAYMERLKTIVTQKFIQCKDSQVMILQLPS